MKINKTWTYSAAGLLTAPGLKWLIFQGDTTSNNFNYINISAKFFYTDD